MEVLTVNPEYVRKLNEIVNASPYFSLLSMKIVDVGPGYSHIEIDVDTKHLQPYGVVHGGVFASIIDAAAFWSVYYNVRDEHAGITTVDLKLNYLAPSSKGKLIAKGNQIKLGKTLGYAEARICDEDGNLLAHGTSTVIILPGKGIRSNSPLPPKFI